VNGHTEIDLKRKQFNNYPIIIYSEGQNKEFYKSDSMKIEMKRKLADYCSHLCKMVILLLI